MWLKLWKSICVMHPDHLALLQKAKPYLNCHFPFRLHGENVNGQSLRFFSNWLTHYLGRAHFIEQSITCWRILTVFVVYCRGMLRKEKLEKEVLGYVQNWNAFLKSDPGILWLTGLTLQSNCKIDSYVPMLLGAQAGRQTAMISEVELWGENTLINRVVIGPVTLPNTQLNYLWKTQVTKALRLTACGYFFFL